MCAFRICRLGRLAAAFIALSVAAGCAFDQEGGVAGSSTEVGARGGHSAPFETRSALAGVGLDPNDHEEGVAGAAGVDAPAGGSAGLGSSLTAGSGSGLADGAALSQPSSDPTGTTPQVVFGAVADVQYCDSAPWGGRHYRASVGKLDAALTTFRQVGADFTIQLGDLIEQGWVSYQTILDRFVRSEAGDVYHVLGNHDWAVSAARRAEVPAVLGLAGATYYSFSRGGWRFIVTDGTELSTYATEPESPERVAVYAMLRELYEDRAPNAQSHNGGMSPQQLAWLAGELDLSRAVRERAIVFGHFPIFPPRSYHNLWNAEAMRAVLERHADVAVAYVSGHRHDGGYAAHGGLHHVVLRGMVDSGVDNAFAVFRVYADRIEVTGHGRQRSYELRW